MKHVFHFVKQLQVYAGKILCFNLLGMVAISLFESMGIVLLLPMVSLSGMMSVQTKWTLLSDLNQLLQSFSKTTGLSLVLGCYVLLMVGQNLLERNLTIRNIRIIQGFGRQLRMHIYSAFLQAGWSFFLKKRKSDLTNLLTAELARVIYGTNLMLQLGMAVLFTLIQIGFAFLLSPAMTAFVLCSGGVLALYSHRFIKRARKLGNRTSELGQSYLAGITDHFNGVKDIKSNHMEQSRLDWHQSLTRAVVDEQVAYIKLKSTSELHYKISSALFIAVFIFLSVTFFHSRAEELLVIIVIFARLWPRFTGIQTNLQQLASTIPAFEAIVEIQEECKNAREFAQSIDSYRNAEPIALQEGLECRNVSFRYNQAEETYALREIDVHIPANRMTAIVGRSGAGKSTLIDIMMGLLRPDSGGVFIDGQPLTDERIVSLRRSISYVPQDPFLFNGTLRENLMMMKPDASEEQIWNALKFSASAVFVRKLPQGLDTILGDRGIRLSGGERQRLVLARAILKNPSIIVLDEATSALDTENEAKIQEALEALKGKLTIIVIAHRLSTIRNADHLIVLDQGKIVQKGGYMQLANEKKGLFSQLLGTRERVELIR